jgi:hypothetical protein
VAAGRGHLTVHFVQETTVSISAQGSAGIKKKQLPRKVRRAWLIVHVVSSVGWLGIEIAMLALCLTGMAAGHPASMRGRYDAAAALADTTLLPAALLMVVSGVVLSVGTKWGLARYHWVFAKLVIGGVLLVASAFTLNANLRTVADLAGSGSPAGGDTAGLAGMMSVIALLGLAATVLSILKPWGRIDWRRIRAAVRPTRAEETS